MTSSKVDVYNTDYRVIITENDGQNYVLTKIYFGSGLADINLPNFPLHVIEAVVVQTLQITEWYKRIGWGSSKICTAETREKWVRQVVERVFLSERNQEVIRNGEILNQETMLRGIPQEETDDVKRHESCQMLRRVSPVEKFSLHPHFCL